MANRPAAIHRRMAGGDLLLLIDSGAVLIAAAGSAVIASTVLRANHVVDAGGGGFALVAFVVFLLGVWMATLGLVAGRFPGAAARIAVAIARALRRYMFSGLGW
ncbi:hypothetical protein HU200_043021 [Digitaria exilis]|uniref:Uncharacterized protein n=1 Tax=Digitaria exilis TaxID=1010633 RepID=A0A835EGN3_9POAL|nr:hypothetical protein HU200_043021 [Digitaria exilis]